MSGLSKASFPSSSRSCISLHFVLHVNVIKNVGAPYSATVVNASKDRLRKCRRLPVTDLGHIVFCVTGTSSSSRKSV